MSPLSRLSRFNWVPVFTGSHSFTAFTVACSIYTVNLHVLYITLNIVNTLLKLL